MSTLGSQDMADDPRCRLIRIHLAKEAAMVGLGQALMLLKLMEPLLRLGQTQIKVTYLKN